MILIPSKAAVLRMTAALLVFFAALSGRCMADQTVLNVKAECDPKSDSATITMSEDYVGQYVAGNGTYSADDLPHYVEHKRPFTLCDLGVEKVISAKVGINKNHPRNNNVEIYINSFRIPMYIDFDKKVSINLSSEHSGRYCVNDSPCATFEIADAAPSVEKTLPSFDCAKASNAVETAICGDPWLPVYDRRLAEAYSGLLAASPDPNTVRARQRAWLKSRARACGLPDRGVLPKSFDDARAKECLARLYDQETMALNVSQAKALGRKWAAVDLIGAWSSDCEQSDATRMTVERNSDGIIGLSISRDLLEFEPETSAYAIYGAVPELDGRLGLKLYAKEDPNFLISLSLLKDGDRLRIWSVVGDEGFPYVKDGVEHQGPATGRPRSSFARCQG